MPGKKWLWWDRAADDNGRQLEARPPQLRELRSVLTLLSIHSERGTRNAWDLEIEIVNG